MPIRKISRSWGTETIIGQGSHVVRVYQSDKKVTVDLSQVRDKNWGKLIACQRKYPSTSKIVLPAEADTSTIIKWWMS